jgi:hypothetical protein
MRAQPLFAGFTAIFTAFASAAAFASCSGENTHPGGTLVDAGLPDTSSMDAGDAIIDPPFDAGCGTTLDLDASPGDLTGQCGACGAPGGPIGGGTGYPRVVPISAATTVVSTREELLAALAAAAPCDIVYVRDDAEIDLTGDADIAIPARVTLASGRGAASATGGLLFTTQHGVPSLFKPEDGVRFTGLRLRGPQDEVGDDSYDADGGTPISIGIHARLIDVEVDNCELYGWSHTSVFVSAARAHVHHSSIHHNQRIGFGYGVLVSGASWALIEANVFDSNRHSIAGNGDPNSGYEARFNRVFENATRHSFDMHGKTVADSGVPVAGNTILIHHNTFLLTTQRAVLIRGRPATGAWIEHNSLAHDDITFAIAQEQNWGNFFVMDNCFPTTMPICP